MEPLLLGFFGTAVFVISDVRLGVREVVAEKARGSSTSAIVHSVHNNILPHIATQCCLFGCESQPRRTVSLQAWLSHTFRAPENMQEEIEHDAASVKVRSALCSG